MVMFLLSLQTGLIEMELPQRLGAMSIILFIVAASLFQTVLEITHPVLLSLSASSRNVWSHLKVRFIGYIDLFIQDECMTIVMRGFVSSGAKIVRIRAAFVQAKRDKHGSMSLLNSRICVFWGSL